MWKSISSLVKNNSTSPGTRRRGSLRSAQPSQDFLSGRAGGPAGLPGTPPRGGRGRRPGPGPGPQPRPRPRRAAACCGAGAAVGPGPPALRLCGGLGSAPWAWGSRGARARPGGGPPSCVGGLGAGGGPGGAAPPAPREGGGRLAAVGARCSPRESQCFPLSSLSHRTLREGAVGRLPRSQPLTWSGCVAAFSLFAKVDFI